MFFHNPILLFIFPNIPSVHHTVVPSDDIHAHKMHAGHPDAVRVVILVLHVDEEHKSLLETISW